MVIIIIHIFRAAPAPTVDPYAEDMKNRKIMALECIDRVKIDKKIIEMAMQYPTKLPNDIKYKEFLTCSYKKQKFQSADGKMLYDNIYDFLTRFYNRSDLKTLDICKNVTASNDGEMAFNSLECIMTQLYEFEEKI
ncbi:hypothetical protein NQ314_003610 [Rhamnusium bicolor]|uniref:Uncharacterized protein n=1 Tax=Rhamnusium bicolor TaxID=1586634 RepID=A0AAV8ZLR9_9CUCU|nr:hypothetical protein NQ314_003610 [Rhamnusium bicolor]